jgi:hypothetical protein
MTNFATRVGRERVAEIGLATNRLAPVIFKNRAAVRAETSKPGASTSARDAKVNTANFAHLLPTAEQRARYQSAGLGADNAAAPDRDPDRDLAMKIIAAGKKRRGET